MTAYPTGPEAGIVYTLETSGGYQAVFNDPTSPFYVGALTGDDAITGLDSPEIRESAGDNTEDDGGFHGFFWAGRRPITLSADIIGATPAARNAMLTRLQQASMALRSDATLKFTPSGSIPQQIKVRRQQPLRTTGGWKKRVFLALVAEDPHIYSQALYTSSPILTGAPLTIENQGSAYSLPSVRINGPGVKPEIINTISGFGFHLAFKTGYTLTGGQYVDVDFLTKTVTHSSGADHYEYIDWLDTFWWGLTAGTDNSVDITWASGNTGASTAVVSWRDAWM